MKGRLSTRVQTRSFVFPKVWIDGCACVCLRGGSSSITYTLYGRIIPPWAPTIHAGRWTSLFTDVMCSSRSPSPSFLFGDDALSRAWIKKSPFFREENHRLDVSSSIIGRKKQRFERWWRLIVIDKLIVFWNCIENSNISISSLVFLFLCTFQKARG